MKKEQQYQTGITKLVPHAREDDELSKEDLKALPLIRKTLRTEIRKAIQEELRKENS